MKIVISAKEIEQFISLLRAKAIEQCKRCEGNDSKKGFWQAGQAEGYVWAADHLETLLEFNEEEMP